MNNISFELKIRLQNNENRQKEVLRLIDILPKGHINILNRNNKGYYYLTYREGKKVKNEYLGPVLSTDLSDIIEKLRRRKIFDTELISLKKEEKTLRRLISTLK